MVCRNKVLTERFTRTGPFTMEYEYTLEDPSTFRTNSGDDCDV